MHTLSSAWIQQGNILLDRIQEHIDRMNYQELLEWSSDIDLDKAPIQLGMKILRAMIDKSPVVKQLRGEHYGRK
jgi:hypothetical protein